MNTINKVILSGRLTRDVESKTASNGTAIAQFNLAVDRQFKKDGQQSADFISCTSFGKTAEFIEKYFHKGSKILVIGNWQTGSYKNKDGQTVYTNNCVVEIVEFGETRGGNNEQNAPAVHNDPVDDFMNVGGDSPFA